MSIWLNETERIRLRVSFRVIESYRLDANNPKRIRRSYQYAKVYKGAWYTSQAITSTKALTRYASS
jgi:hypothetical protein